MLIQFALTTVKWQRNLGTGSPSHVIFLWRNPCDGVGKVGKYYAIKSSI